MGDATGIEWTDATWNPVRGCSRTIAAGAKQSGCGDGTGGGCYAERTAGRFCGPGQPYEGLVRITKKGPRWTGRVRLVPAHLMDPFRWRRPRRIFTNSMSDMFHEELEDWHIDRIVAVMMICCLHETRGGHTFQTLTKRAKRLRSYFTDPKTQGRVAVAAGQMMEDGDGWHDTIAFREEGLVHPLMWWGVSVENQDAADERIPDLLATPAAIRFLSCEPLLGPVDLCHVQHDRTVEIDALNGTHGVSRPHAGRHNARISWVIAGCESGPGARPCDVAWLRSLRDQCAAVGVPFFLKQAVGETARCDNPPPDNCGQVVRYQVVSERTAIASCGCTIEGGEACDPPPIAEGDGSKRKPGGVIGAPYLDGKQHLAFPKVTP